MKTGYGYPEGQFRVTGNPDVQRRLITLVPLLFDPGVPDQGKYEEEKKRTGARFGEAGEG
jgi:hypothetical protein